MTERSAKSDGVYKKTQRQIQKEYNDALEAAIRKNRDYFKVVQKVQSGEILPSRKLRTEAQIEAWKRGYLRRYIDQHRTIESMAEEIRNAGMKCRKNIRAAMNKIYGAEIATSAEVIGASKIISLKTDDQVRVLLDRKLSAFDKGALEKLADAKVAQKRLRREFAVGILKGDSDRKMVERIQNITGMEASHAQTVLRTERTRVTGMAQQDAADEYYEKTGVSPYKRWICVFHNSRESHIATHGEIVRFDQRFSNGLLHPGDNAAPAEETINCQCRMEVFLYE